MRTIDRHGSRRASATPAGRQARRMRCPDERQRIDHRMRQEDWRCRRDARYRENGRFAVRAAVILVTLASIAPDVPAAVAGRLDAVVSSCIK